MMVEQEVMVVVYQPGGVPINEVEQEVVVVCGISVQYVLTDCIFFYKLTVTRTTARLHL
jgi:hypothetical protein